MSGLFITLTLKSLYMCINIHITAYGTLLSKKNYLEDIGIDTDFIILIQSGRYLELRASHFSRIHQYFFLNAGLLSFLENI